MVGSGNLFSLNGLRHRIVSNTKDPPKIGNLPPTDEAARQHINRARFHVLIWSADKYNITRQEVSKFGWTKEDDIMVPIHDNLSVSLNVFFKHVAASQRSCVQGQHLTADQPKCHARHIAIVNQMNSVQMVMLSS